MNLNFTLIVAALVFLTFIVFTMKFIWPPLLKAIENRQRKIADGLLAAEQGQEQLKHAEEEASIIIRDAREESSTLLNACEMQKVALINEAKFKAKNECDFLIEQTKSGIKVEVEKAKSQLRNQVSSLVIATASQIIGREINEKNHDQLLKSLAEKL